MVQKEIKELTPIFLLTPRVHITTRRRSLPPIVRGAPAPAIGAAWLAQAHGILLPLTPPMHCRRHSSTPGSPSLYFLQVQCLHVD